MKGFTVSEAPLAEMKYLILKLTLKIKINCLRSPFNSFASTPLNSACFPKGIPAAFCVGAEEDVEPKVSHLHPANQGGKISGG